MISTIQSLQLNNKIVKIDLEEIPVVSQISERILQQQFNTYLPPALNKASFAGQIQTIESTAKELQAAKDSSKKDKLIACLKVAFLVACIVAAVLVGIYAAPPLFIIPLLAFGIVSMFCLVDATTRLGMKQDEGIAFGAILGFGLILPLYEAFTRVSRLEDSLTSQQASANKTISDLSSANQKLLPRNYNFYQEKATALLNNLENKIAESEASLATMQKLAVRSETGEKDLRDQIANLRTAQQEISEVNKLLQKFS